MIGEKRTCLGDGDGPSTSFHYQTPKLDKLLYDVIHPRSVLLVQTQKRLEPRLLSLSCKHALLARAWECWTSDMSTQDVSISPIQERYSQSYQLHPRTMTPSARNKRLVLQRLCGLASCSSSSADRDQKLGYIATAFAPRQTLLLPLFHLLCLPYCLQPPSPSSITEVSASTKIIRGQDKRQVYSHQSSSNIWEGCRSRSCNST